MVRSLFRFVGIWLLAAAVVAAVIDGTRSIADSRVLVTPLMETWRQLHVASLNLSQSLIERYLNPLAWDPVLTSFLQLPTAVAVGIVATLFLIVGRPKRDVLS